MDVYPICTRLVSNNFLKHFRQFVPIAGGDEAANGLVFYISFVPIFGLTPQYEI